MNLLQTLRGQWDVMTGRYAAAPIGGGADLDDGSALLRAVRGEELHRIVGDDPWASPAFGGTTPPTRAWGVRDRQGGRMVGVLQTTEARHLLGVAATVGAYALDRLSPAVLERTVVVTFFALLPEARKTAAGLVLLAESLRLHLQDGASVASFIAEPALLQRYLRLGARPLAPMRASAYGGYRIPLVLLAADRAHLEAVHSPLRLLVKAGDFGDDDPTLPWWRDFERRHGRIDTGVAAYQPAADEGERPVHALLSRGLSDAEVQALLAGSLTLDSAVGDRILAQGDGGRLLGVVAAGVVHAVINGRVVGAMGPGEPFGEIAFVTGEPRSADLVAAVPGTRLLQFSPAALAALPPAAALVFWRNLAWCLAQRLKQRTA
ncbi:MAG: cyclic nucleotide-binding domain-containing protein [Proteobacteria bacterium]|nr:cyclic nucleotide-binding domain-containing protein [Pseudomonadota bacterium]